MKTFDHFLREADVRSVQAQKAASAGADAYGGVGDIAGSVASVAGGNVLGVWGVIKSVLQAYKGIVETSTAISHLADIQTSRKKLIAFIGRQHGKNIAEEYAEIVFDADESIIPLIPPASWNEIVSSFVAGLNGRIDDYRNLTFNHAVSVVLEKNLDRVKGVAANNAQKMDAHLTRLEKQYENPLKEFIRQTTGRPAPVSKEKERASQRDEPSSSWAADAMDRADRETGYSSTFDDDKPKEKQYKKNWVGGYKWEDALELAIDQLEKTHHSIFGSDEEEGPDPQTIVKWLRDKEFARRLSKSIGSWRSKWLTPEMVIQQAKRQIAEDAEAKRYSDLPPGWHH